MVGFFLGPHIQPPEPPRRPAQETPQQQSHVKELENDIRRLQLLNQALWEILRDKLRLSEEEFLAKVHEVDMRDGQEDGRMSYTALKCPQCGRVSSSRHWRCLYCGLEFERPIMG